MIILLGLYLILPIFSTFLIETGNSGSTGGLDATHYTDLMDLITQERTYRKQMEQYLANELQQTIKNIKNETALLQTNCQKLLNKNLELKTKIAEIERNAGGQDQIANITAKLSSSEKAFKEQIDELTMQVDTEFFNLTSLQGGLIVNLTSAVEQVVRNAEMVGLQACQGYIDRETKIFFFNDIRTSYGFDNITILTPLQKTGIFNTEKPGLYLVIAGISSVESEFQFSIVKNNSTSLAQVEVVPTYRYRDSNNNMFHTGTGSAIVQLDVHDTIFIRAEKGTITYSEYSCLSVVKLK